MATEAVATSLKLERSSGRLSKYAEARREVINLELASELDTKTAKANIVEEQAGSWEEEWW